MFRLSSAGIQVGAEPLHQDTVVGAARLRTGSGARWKCTNRHFDSSYTRISTAIPHEDVTGLNIGTVFFFFSSSVVIQIVLLLCISRNTHGQKFYAMSRNDVTRPLRNREHADSDGGGRRGFLYFDNELKSNLRLNRNNNKEHLQKKESWKKKSDFYRCFRRTK